MPKYVKFMMGSYEFASRNQREVSVASDVGYSVAVSDARQVPGVELSGGVTIIHRRKRTNNQVFVRRFLTVVDWLICAPPHLRSLKADCLSCHDLVALTIGWLSTVGVKKRHRPHLIYDSHELELGRSTTKSRTVFTLALIKLLEGFLIKRCSLTIAVNDSIADRLQQIHSLTERPVVVRSTPNTWTLDPTRIQANRNSFCRSLGVHRNAFIAMYHGIVIPGRGIENLIVALAHAPRVATIILGNANTEYLAQLRSLARASGVAERVIFHPAVPVENLRHYVAAADVGVMPIQATSENNYLSLPNKLFENIQSLTPVIGSAYPELSRIIGCYDIGLTVDPTDPRLIADALNKIRTDTELRHRFRLNLQTAKSELCWENECNVLHASFRRLFETEASARV